MLASAILSAGEAPASAVVNRPQVEITTSLGVIRVELFADEAPETVANFLADRKSVV